MGPPPRVRGSPAVAAVLLALLATAAGPVAGLQPAGGPDASGQAGHELAWSQQATPAGEPVQVVGGSPTWLVAVASDGTGYRSTDQALSWHPIDGLPSLAKAHIQADPGAPSTGYIAAVGGVWRTTDAGTSWDRVLTVDRAARIHVDATGLVLVGARYADASNHLLRSTDRGATWEDLHAPLPDGEPICGVAFGPSPDQLLTMTDQASWYSQDGGATWTETAGAGLDFAVEDSGVVWRNEMTYLERTTDGGATWERVHPPALGAPIGPRTGGGIYLASFIGLLTTTDGGATWENLGYPALSVTATSLRGAPGDEEVVLVTDERIGISRIESGPDGLPLLEGHTRGLAPVPLDRVAGAGDGALAVAIGPNGVHARYGPGQAWSHTGAGLAPAVLTALAVAGDGATAYVGGQDTTQSPVVEASRDGGHRFQAHHFSLADPAKVAALAVDPNNPLHAAAVLSTEGTTDQVHVTEDGGATWARVLELPIGLHDVAWDQGTGGLLIASELGLLHLVEPDLPVPVAGPPAPEVLLVASHAGTTLAAGGPTQALWRGLPATGLLVPWADPQAALASLLVDPLAPGQAWATTGDGALLVCSGPILQGACRDVGPKGQAVADAWVDPQAGQVHAATGAGLLTAPVP